jgi:hypothetical protein
MVYNLAACPWPLRYIPPSPENRLCTQTAQIDVLEIVCNNRLRVLSTQRAEYTGGKKSSNSVKWNATEWLCLVMWQEVVMKMCHYCHKDPGGRISCWFSVPVDLRVSLYHRKASILHAYTDWFYSQRNFSQSFHGFKYRDCSVVVT